MTHPTPKIADAYSHWDGREQFDAIVIGSGMGGLTAAAILAKRAGKRVLVLERHYTPGGFTHVFKRTGFEWDVGLHYIGELHRPGNELRAVFDYVTEGQVTWEDVGDVYDRVVIPSGTYDLVAGQESFRARLKKYFPRETRAIDRYLKLVAACYQAARFYLWEKTLPAISARTFGPLLRYPFLRYARRTTREVLKELTRDQDLIGVLTGQWYDYGLPPAQSSFGMHAILTRHYQDGACYPVGGASRIAAAIAPVIAAGGGRILVNAEVAEVLVERGSAVGVRMSDGREIRAGLVISDTGAHNTFTRLLPASVAEGWGLSKQIGVLQPSASHLNLYVGLGESDEQLKLDKANIWIHPSADHDRNVAEFLADPQQPLPCTWICFSSAKDPTFPHRYPGRATMQVMSFASFNAFQPWQNAPWRRRGSEYEALKEQYTTQLLDTLYKYVPQTRGKVSFCELATPLSTRHFANYAQGEIYGLACTPARFQQSRLRPRMQVKNLYLTGQDVAIAGVAGAMLGGVLCACSILGSALYLTILREGRRLGSALEQKTISATA
jgi:all-trans-retinol 13,14-reductase